jgi:hypothetical protein
MSPLDYYCLDYFAARERFREAVRAAGGDVQSLAIDAAGPAGQSLTIDVGLLGSAQARRRLIVSSGLHGVEGAFGSAIQRAWLERAAAARTRFDETAVVLPHALNPYGYAWRRRWNEDNIDLNRNFLHDLPRVLADAAYREALAIYKRLRRDLNPLGSPSRFDHFLPRAVRAIFRQGWRARRRLHRAERPPLWAIARLFRLGLRELQKALPIGQYEWQRCLFYGGRSPAQSTRLLRDHFAAWIGDADAVLHLDLHSGLGLFGEYRLLIPDAPESANATWLRERFGEVIEPAASGDTAYHAHGVMGNYFQQRFADRAYRFVTAEFGTYPPIRVLGVLRAENHAHHRGRPGSRVYEWAKRELVEMFCPANRAWRRRVLQQGVELIERSLRA